MIVLAGVASVTERIKLGTGCLIPHRNPVHAALLLASLAKMAGSDRILVGFGLGSFDHEFDIVGMRDSDRRVVIERTGGDLPEVMVGRAVSHNGTYYQFEDAEIRPTPFGRDLPIWYSGTSLASVRRAIEYCDGWIPGRMPRRDYLKRINRLESLAEEAGKPRPPAGVIPYTSPGRSMEEAKRAFDLDGLIEEARRRYSLPDGGEITDLEHLDGAIIAGPPEEDRGGGEGVRGSRVRPLRLRPTSQV